MCSLLPFTFETRPDFLLVGTCDLRLIDRLKLHQIVNSLFDLIYCDKLHQCLLWHSRDDAIFYFFCKKRKYFSQFTIIVFGTKGNMRGDLFHVYFC